MDKLSTDNKLKEAEFEISLLSRDNDNLRQSLAMAEASIEDFKNSTSWKITAPLRKTASFVRLSLNALKMLGKLPMFFTYARQFGFSQTLQIARDRIKPVPSIDLKKLIKPEQKELDFQRSFVFDKTPLISIVVPLYNSNTEHLIEMLDSVATQTYAKWELVLIDANEQNSAVVEPVCTGRAAQDTRIVYKKIGENLGISDNTNIGLALSTGSYIALLDHDDILHPSALFEVVAAINETGSDLLYSDELNFFDSLEKGYSPHFKPDFSPDTLRSYNYICHLMVSSRELYEKCGGMRAECSGSQDYDLALRLSEQAQSICHIPKLLYFWRQHPSSFSSDIHQKAQCIAAAKRALSDHLERLCLKGEVLDADAVTCYRIKYKIEGNPLVSIIIPNKDHVDDLKKCLDSIIAQTSYSSYEVIIVENNSEDSETAVFYEQLKDPRFRVMTYEGEFNFSLINNFGVEQSKGEYLLFLNNDTEVISPQWIEEMLMFAQRKNVGAVGAKLYYTDDTIQHAGIILGIGGTAGHSHRGANRKDGGYSNRLLLAQNVSAVTAACLMVSRAKFDEVEGFAEEYVVSLNDVDFCLKLREQGYLNVFTPYAELYHYESKSRGYEDTPEKMARFRKEIIALHAKWDHVFSKGDPYYNPHLTLKREDFSLD